jgi:hypothetical protein
MRRFYHKNSPDYGLFQTILSRTEAPVDDKSQNLALFTEKGATHMPYSPYFISRPKIKADLKVVHLVI